MWIFACHSDYIAVIGGSGSLAGRPGFQDSIPGRGKSFYLLAEREVHRSSRLRTDGAYWTNSQLYFYFAVLLQWVFIAT